MSNGHKNSHYKTPRTVQDAFGPYAQLDCVHRRTRATPLTLLYIATIVFALSFSIAKMLLDCV